MQHYIIELKKEFSELAYMAGDPSLEVYLPLNMSEMGWQDKLRPCMLILPGGGYGMVSQREGDPIAMHLLPHGYNVFVLQYTVAPNRYPNQLVQVAAAMELIHRNSKKWNCDPNRIAIMGFSAGGHLAAHYSNAYNCADVRKVFPNSKPVQASVLSYPVITADPQYAHQGSFENLLGYYPEGEQLAQFSCDKLVTKDTPPAFLWHTAEDGAVPVMNSLLYAQALSAYGIPFALHIYPYGYHGLSTADRQTLDYVPDNAKHVKNWLPEMLTWLNQEFQNI